jgi:hypothetical protein
MVFSFPVHHISQVASAGKPLLVGCLKSWVFCCTKVYSPFRKLKPMVATPPLIYQDDFLLPLLAGGGDQPDCGASGRGRR